MEMAFAVGLAAHRKPVQDFGRSAAPRPLTFCMRPSRAASSSAVKKSYAKLSIERADLVRPQAGNGEHFQHSLRDFLSHFFERGMSAGGVDFLDDIPMASPTPGISCRRSWAIS